MFISIKSIRALRLLTPLSAFGSLISQTIAILSSKWLHTEESMPNPNYEKFKMPSHFEFLKKFTTSGLWNLCYNDPPDLQMHCVKIDYFSQEDYIPDQSDSTMAIPYAARKASVYILTSTLFLVMGLIINLVSQICRYRCQIYILVSAILFIVAGLMILTGIVVYISTFKGEVGYKLRRTSQFQDALLDYQYGYSFLLLVIDLVFCEITGTLSIFLYIWQKHFKIMIDTERDEVLKNNIINFFKNEKKQNQCSNTFLNQPIFKIIHDGTETEKETYFDSNNQFPINHNLLNVEFGVEAELYQYGRHGSRGRRNSRSSDSYLGSPRETCEIKNVHSSEPINSITPINLINSMTESESGKLCFNKDNKTSMINTTNEPQELNASSLFYNEKHIISKESFDFHHLSFENEKELIKKNLLFLSAKKRPISSLRNLQNSNNSNDLEAISNKSKSKNDLQHNDSTLV